MQVTWNNFPVPIVTIDDFLPEADAQRILTECIDLKKFYQPAKIFDGPTATKVDPTYRKNDVVYLDTLFQGVHENSDILTTMKKAIWGEEAKRVWSKGNTLLEVLNYATHSEAVLSRYGKCDFYGKHRDTRFDHLTYRLVTLVYYVNTIPEKFTGGSLTFWHEDQSLKAEPKHNRLVVFPSWTMHEVENVRLPDDAAWEDGRFSLNYWMGFTS